MKILHQYPRLDVVTFLKSSEEVTETPTDKVKAEDDDKVLGSFIDTYEVTPEAKRRLWFLSYYHFYGCSGNGGSGSIDGG